MKNLLKQQFEESSTTVSTSSSIRNKKPAEQIAHMEIEVEAVFDGDQPFIAHINVLPGIKQFYKFI